MHQQTCFMRQECIRAQQHLVLHSFNEFSCCVQMMLMILVLVHFSCWNVHSFVCTCIMCILIHQNLHLMMEQKAAIKHSQYDPASNLELEAGMNTYHRKVMLMQATKQSE